MNEGLLAHKLGKRAPRLDPRTLKLAKYLPPTVPPAPASASYLRRVSDWGMMLNDSLGDCVPAAAGHMVQQWTAYAGVERVLSDRSILRAYEDVGGYVDGDPSTDNGTDMLSFVKYWRATGMGAHKVLAFVSVDPSRPDQVRQAIHLFGNCFLGVQLPVTVQGETVWSVPRSGPFGDASPGSWGGHCVPLMSYSQPRATYTALSWGAPLTVTAGFLRCYADEAYAVLSQDWIERNGLAPSLFDLAALRADLAAL